MNLTITIGMGYLSTTEKNEEANLGQPKFTYPVC